MNDWFTILITSGVIGILISSLINLFISLKTIRSQRDITSFKAYVDFLKEKVDLLRNLRSTVARLRSSNLVDVLVIYNHGDKDKASSWLEEEKRKFVEEADAYKEIRYCFAKPRREKLDRLLKQIGPIDWLFIYLCLLKQGGINTKNPSSGLVVHLLNTSPVS